MNIVLRNLAFGVAVVLPVLGGCRSEPKPTADILAQDSLLNLAVMSANTDSLSAGTDEPVSATPAPVAIPKTSAAHKPIAAIVPQARAPRRKVTASSRRSRDIARSTRRHVRLASSVPVSRPRTRAAAATVEAPAHRILPRGVWRGRAAPVAVVPAPAPIQTETVITPRAPARTSAIFPAGSDLTLASDQKICTNTGHAGDRFTSRLAEDVVGPNGVVIPSGAVATGEISSIGNGIGVSLASLSFRGRNYPIGSEVTYTQLDKIRTGTSGAASNRWPNHRPTHPTVASRTLRVITNAAV